MIYAPNHKLWLGMIISMDLVLKPSHLTKATITVRPTRLTVVKLPPTKASWSSKIQFRRTFTSLIWPNKMNRLNFVSCRPKRVHRTRCLIIFRLCAKLRNSSEKIQLSQKNTALWSFPPSRKMNNLFPLFNNSNNSNTCFNTKKVVMSQKGALIACLAVSRCTQLIYRSLSRFCYRNSTHRPGFYWRLSQGSSWRKELFCRNLNPKARQPHIWPAMRDNTCGSKY